MCGPHDQSKLRLILMEDLTKRKCEGESISLRGVGEIKKAWQQRF